MAEISPVFAAYIIFDIDSLCTSRTSFRGSILFVSEYTCISYSTWTLVYGYAFEQMANLVEDLALQIFLWLRYKITAVIKYESILLKSSSEATTLRVAIFPAHSNLHKISYLNALNLILFTLAKPDFT